ncbi:carbon storage regulator CsrA [Desulfuromonas thiophila]|jgi:carbon storage regulator|uniref:Translational regulator CsrA n=1 Tax=Desulfuromonas thiophila TaxID=57664 RepID=A0A1G7BHM5_9BACT|nr:carbon storage regulator CsrA [Desulfuromonas thiophila]MDY0397187.1 carbon storage regulator CsrA [Desulfuromonas thiophila]MDY0399062.1 carbon storage regulator CsrA [Desulfuromonas thiophila]SDE26482.1 carbon storage regulator, CsrA [Desulfuromonas thiophila]
MLVLTRKLGEGILIGEDIRLQIVEIKGNTVRLGIDAPRHKKIYRQELYDHIQQENRAATSWALADLDLLGTPVSPPEPEEK